MEIQWKVVARDYVRLWFYGLFAIIVFSALPLFSFLLLIYCTGLNDQNILLHRVLFYFKSYDSIQPFITYTLTAAVYFLSFMDSAFSYRKQIFLHMNIVAMAVWLTGITFYALFFYFFADQVPSYQKEWPVILFNVISPLMWIYGMMVISFIFSRRILRKINYIKFIDK